MNIPLPTHLCASELSQAPVIHSNATDRIDDEALVQRVLTGDPWAKEVFFKRFVDTISGTVIRLLQNRADAQDIVHDTFVTAFAQLPKLKAKNAVKAWLIKIAVRKVLRRFRRRKLLRTFGFDTRVDDKTFESLAALSAPPMSGFLCLAFFAAATVNETEDLVIDAPSCKPRWFKIDHFKAMLRRELDVAWFNRVSLNIPDCDQPEIVGVTVSSTTSARVVQMSLKDAPEELRLRALVLAIVELRPAPKTQKPKDTPAPWTRPTPIQPKAVTSKVPKVPYQASAHFAFSAFPTRRTTLFGGVLFLTRRLIGVMRGRIGLGVMMNRFSDPLGQLTVRHAFGTLGFELCSAFPPLSLCAGPQAELGYASFSATSDVPGVKASSSGSVIVTIHGRFAARYLLWSQLAIALQTGVGLVGRGAAAVEGGRSQAGLTGLSIALLLGLSWGFGA